MKVDSFELDQNKKIPIDNEALDNAMEESEEWEAPQVSQSSAFFTTFASKIYKDFNSGVRELYNNEARACRTARNKHGARPRIEIEIDIDERTFILHGVDSLGISEEIFKQIIKVLGKSGNMTGNEVGMFGMGFVSYQMLTDFMTLDTWTREDTESNAHYTVFCREDLHTKKVIQKEPTLDTFGTRLEMILKPDVIINEVIDTIKDCAKFSTVETIITVENASDEDIENGLPDGRIIPEQYASVKEWFDLNNTIRQWTHEKYGMLEIQKFDTKTDKQMKSIWRRNKQIDFYHEFDYEDDDVEFHAKLALYKLYEYDDNGKLDTNQEKHSRIATGNSQRSWDNEDKTGKIFLVGVPIDAQLSWISSPTMMVENLLDNCEWYINIKNERAYSPNANRDDLERKAIEKLSSLISRVMCKNFKDNFSISSPDDYRNSIYKPIYQSNLDYELQTQSILGDEGGGNFLTALNSRYPTVGNTYGKTLSSILEAGNKVISLQSLRGDMMIMFEKHFKDNNIEFIRCKDHDVMRILEQWGVTIGEEYKAINKLKMKHGKSGSLGSKAILDRSVSLTNNGRYSSQNYFGGRNYRNGRGRTVSSTVGEVNDQNEADPHRMIQFHNNKDEFKAVKDWLDWNSGADCIAVCRKHKGLKIDTPDEFCQWFRTQPIHTTDGELSIAQIEANYDREDVFYLTEGLPALNQAEAIEELALLLDDTVLFAWVNKELADRLSMYNKFRVGGVGSPHVRGKGLSLQHINILYKHGVASAQEHVELGHRNQGEQVKKILQYYKIKDVVKHDSDKLILEHMITQARDGNISGYDESEITDLVLDRLGLSK